MNNFENEDETANSVGQEKSVPRFVKQRISDKASSWKKQHRDSPMTFEQWMLTLFVLMIPFVNLIMYFVWAFGNSGNVNRKTFCQASLLWMFFAVVAIVFFDISILS